MTPRIVAEAPTGCYCAQCAAIAKAVGSKVEVPAAFIVEGEHAPIYERFVTNGTAPLCYECAESMGAVS